VSVESDIKEKLSDAFRPVHLELFNESHMHAGPATDSHFKLVLVAGQFDGLSTVQRHRAVYRVLSDELAGPVHALALHLYSPAEWERHQGVSASPLCSGKNK
jgi:BolA protein